ncbi:chorismate synthase [Methanobacterium sp.]|uniref:chorismate synthase n=1 Tax=Methanobacterium sp. TaxID=2164 RepID=UPI002ABA42FA|nr:chorismate synthase [Methanobacterium sp.]MDY9922342.1 chorismate synthase [Methanobacterium sp.]
MAGNTTGDFFAVTTFGSSHGRALGAVIDGCPSGLELSVEDIQSELDRRRPGTSKITTSRGETDQVEVLSGIFQGKTDGTPITGVVYNKDADSSVYEPFKNKPRPGHGDYTWTARYGFYDYRGGGRGSGRTTIGHVIGGAVAKKLLELVEIKVVSHVTQVADVKANHVAYGLIEEYASGNPVRCADEKAAILMEGKILEAKEKGDSVGGVVETLAFGVPAGLGEPVFDKLDADLARALMGIGSVKGVEIGFGFQLAESTASVTNDEYYLERKEIKTTTNTSGGIIGGISDGMPIVARMAVKPTPSISTVQKTVDLEKREETEIRIKGRHDPCICPRVTPVAESAMAMVLADHLLRSGFINPRHV